MVARTAETREPALLWKQHDDYASVYSIVPGLPYQVTATGGHTGTNAHDLAVACDGIPTVVLSLPLKNMHTPVEICSLSDMESVAGIIAEFASNGTFSGKEVVLIDR